MASEAEALRRQLRAAGVAPRAIRAVWPEWWSEEAEGSKSAVTELKYTVARRLGLSPASLFDGPPRFVWTDRAKFKNVATQSEHELGILTSYGVAVARPLLEATEPVARMQASATASDLRGLLLDSSAMIGLGELVTLSWTFGIPVVQLALFPLPRKRMHAITVQVRGRHAVLIGRSSVFSAQIAYILAHELGHIVLRHLSNSAALIEASDPLKAPAGTDDEESAADAFALELLTGSPSLEVVSDSPNFSAVELASAASKAATQHRVDPGILALCLGHSTGMWRQAFGALKVLQPNAAPVGDRLNAIASTQIDWTSMSGESRDFLAKAVGLSADATS